MGEKRLKVELSVREPRGLLPLWSPNGKLGCLSLEGRPPAGVGTLVHLVVRISEPAARHFDVLGRIAWARHKASATLPEGYGIEFVPEDQAGRDRLYRLARSEIEYGKTRFDERRRTHMPVAVASDRSSRREHLLDLSEGGAFVRTVQPLPVGTEVRLELRPPRALTKLKLAGTVVWARSEGDAPGMGVCFRLDDPNTALKLKRLLDSLGPTG